MENETLESSHPEVFYIEGLKNLLKSTGKPLWWSLIKEILQHRSFPVSFAIIHKSKKNMHDIIYAFSEYARAAQILFVKDSPNNVLFESRLHNFFPKQRWLCSEMRCVLVERNCT